MQCLPNEKAELELGRELSRHSSLNRGLTNHSQSSLNRCPSKHNMETELTAGLYPHHQSRTLQVHCAQLLLDI